MKLRLTADLGARNYGIYLRPLGRPGLIYRPATTHVRYA